MVTAVVCESRSGEKINELDFFPPLSHIGEVMNWYKHSKAVNVEQVPFFST